MNDNHSGYNLKAPGPPGAGSSLRLPGHGPFPRVDDHLVEAEVTRDEIIGGHRIVASPAHPRQREVAAEAKGAMAILTVLDARGLSVSTAQRQEILHCQDLDRLDRWLRRAILASSADEITLEP